MRIERFSFRIKFDVYLVLVLRRALASSCPLAVAPLRTIDVGAKHKQMRINSSSSLATDVPRQRAAEAEPRARKTS